MAASDFLIFRACDIAAPAWKEAALGDFRVKVRQGWRENDFAAGLFRAHGSPDDPALTI
jgi:hypothetical protein